MYITNQRAAYTYMNYSYFYKNRVRYNINTTNKVKYKMCII